MIIGEERKKNRGGKEGGERRGGERKEGGRERRRRRRRRGEMLTGAGDRENGEENGQYRMSYNCLHLTILMSSLFR